VALQNAVPSGRPVIATFGDVSVWRRKSHARNWAAPPAAFRGSAVSVGRGSQRLCTETAPLKARERARRIYSPKARLEKVG
jgi:hypothetical protein